MAGRAPRDVGQWSTPIIWRLAGIGAVVSIVAYLVAVWTGLAATGLPVNDPRLQVVAASAAVAGAAATALLAIRRRIQPMYEVILWSNATTRARWQALGVDQGITDPAEAVAALAGRTDEPSRAARGTLLAALGRTQELEAELEGWSPASSVGAASLARLRVALDVLQGRPPDRAPAVAAAEAIPDERARVLALVVLELDSASRAIARRRNPEADLLAARRRLDGARLDVPIPRAQHLGWIWVTLTVVACAMPIAVAALIAWGLVGLAAWVVAVGLFWLVLRRQVLRTRPGAASQAVG